MYIVAITGGVATGKSTVSKIFGTKGIPIIDADKIARQIVEPGKPCWHKIKEIFGDEVFYPTRELNREALGKLVFSNKEMRAQLNKITHPVIHRRILMEVLKNFFTGKEWIVIELPLLFETGVMIDYIYKVITVACEPETQLQRLIKRNEFSEEEAKKRIAAQMPLNEKCEMSHFVIDNNGALEETEEAALRVYYILKDSNHHWRNRLVLFGCVCAFCFVIYYLKKVFGLFTRSLS